MKSMFSPLVSSVAFVFYYWAILSSRIGLFAAQGNTRFLMIDGIQLAAIVIIAAVSWWTKKRWIYCLLGVVMIAESLFSLVFIVGGFASQHPLPVHFVLWSIALVYFLVAGIVMVKQVWVNTLFALGPGS